MACVIKHADVFIAEGHAETVGRMGKMPAREQTGLTIISLKIVGETV